MCLAGLLTNSALALYLVPSPTAHLAGLLGALCPVLVCPLGPLLGLHQAALLAGPPAAITSLGSFQETVIKLIFANHPQLSSTVAAVSTLLTPPRQPHHISNSPHICALLIIYSTR